MALISSYKTGTISIANDSVTVTGAGVNWTGIRAGDVFWAAGVDVAVASVTGSAQITLAFPWSGPSLAAAAYEIRYTPDAARVLASSREAIASIDALRNEAFASTSVYDTVAAGLAATSEGAQFQVRDDGEMVRYRHDAGGVATEMARYLTADGIDAALAGPVTQIAALEAAALATDEEIDSLSGQIDGVRIGGLVGPGDSAVLVTMNGVPVTGYNAAGQMLAEPAPQMVAATFAGVTPAQADQIAQQSDYVAGLILDEAMRPGDSAIAMRLNGVAIMGVTPEGHIDLRLAPGALADIAARLDLDDMVIEAAPLPSTDLAGDVDAWNVWQRDSLVYFTGRVWGDRDRGYVRMLPNGEAWAQAPSLMQVHLAYGDHTANIAPSIVPSHVVHIATLADGFDQAGLDGAAPTGPAADFARAGAGFAGLIADCELEAATGALPRFGARSEAVEGASLADLGTGQPLANLTRAATEFARLAALYGGSSHVRSVSILHAGDAASATAYRDDLLGLVEAVSLATSADMIGVFGPAGTWDDGTDPAILGAVDALAARGGLPMIPVSPLHWCGIAPGTVGTPDAPSMTMLAELAAQAAEHSFGWAGAGLGWYGPVVIDARRSGTDLFVDFEVMEGFDLIAPTYGVSYSGATITGMGVIADDVGRMTRLQITLSAASAGRLDVAYGRTGTDPTKFANRSDLRDSWSAPSRTGGTLYRYAHPVSIEVA